MTTYQLDIPDWLWEAFKETVPQSETLNDPIEASVAERVAGHDLVDDELQDRAEAYLNGDQHR